MNFKKHKNKSNICSSINWSFYKKNEFVLTFAEMCKEPTQISANNKFYYIDVTNSKQDIILDVIYKNQIEDTFVVKTLVDYDDKIVLVLKRIR